MQTLHHQRTALRAAALALALACNHVHALEWFPREPGPGDTTYLVYADSCGESRPVGDATLDVDAATGVATLVFDTAQELCFGTPPPGAVARLYAFEIPASIGGAQIASVETTIDGAAGAASVRPGTRGVPPSIVGTWYAAGHIRQGFLITMTQRGELAVSWNTYDANGDHLWISGVATTDALSPQATVHLVDTNGGFFAEHPALLSQLKDWGTMDIEYLGCGRLHATWVPAAYTTLDAGDAEFRQLTAPWSDPCDLAAWAAAKGRTLQTVDVAYRRNGISVD